MKNGIIIRILSFAFALMAVSYLMDSVEVNGFGSAVMASLVFALCNTFVKPVLFILSLPITILTLGLFSLVVNGIVFYMASGLVGGFHVSGLWGAIWGSVLVSILNTIITKSLDFED